MKKPISTYLVIFLWITSNFGFSQVKVSEVLQESKFHPNTSAAKLFMIEFWVLLN